jgi:hypothetical protein
MPPLRGNGEPAKPRTRPIDAAGKVALLFTLAVAAIAGWGLALHLLVRLFDFGWRLV